MITLTQISKYTKYSIAVILAFIISFVVSSRKDNNDEQMGTLSPFPYANADIPVSTPFLAIWNGLKYMLENDFMFGRPRSYFSSYAEGRREHESGLVFPDLYKIQSPLVLKDDKIAMQIQEIEPEESYINGFELLRVVHPANSTVYVDSEYRKFHVLSNELVTGSFIAPVTAIGAEGRDLTDVANVNNLETVTNPPEIFEAGDFVDIKYSGLMSTKKYQLVIKSNQRLWVMGESATSTSEGIFSSMSVMKNPALVAGVPMAVVSGAVIGSYGGPVNDIQTESSWNGPGSSGGTCSCGCGSGDDTGTVNAPPHCLVVSYKNHLNEEQHISTVEPRALAAATEIVEIPGGAVDSEGKLSINIVSTQYHHVAFIGLREAGDEIDSQTEVLNLTHAFHHRLQESVLDRLQFKRGSYVHTIPGDLVDLEFRKPASVMAEDENETYLIRAGGFYTPLTPESKQLAGNWTEKLSVEARDRLVSLGIV